MADPAAWKKRVAAWRASGQTAAVYCERNGLVLNSLKYWAQQVRREQAATTPIRLARVERVVVSEPAAVAPATPVVIEVGGARVRVDRGVDQATLATVLAVLSAGVWR